MFVHPQVDVWVFLIPDHEEGGRRPAAFIAASSLTGLQCREKPISKWTSCRRKGASHRLNRFATDEQVAGYHILASHKMPFPGLDFLPCKGRNATAGVHDAKLSSFPLSIKLEQSSQHLGSRQALCQKAQPVNS
jgi:hypothetical protein